MSCKISKWSVNNTRWKKQSIKHERKHRHHSSLKLCRQCLMMENKDTVPMDLWRLWKVCDSTNLFWCFTCFCDALRWEKDFMSTCTQMHAYETWYYGRIILDAFSFIILVILFWWCHSLCLWRGSTWSREVIPLHMYSRL